MLRRALQVLGVLLGLVVVCAIGFYVYVSATWRTSYASHPEPAIRASKDPEIIRQGEYLFHAVAHCSTCHAPPEYAKEKVWPTPMPQPKGGFVWEMPLFGKFVAANLTSDEETGIGRMSDGAIARVVKEGVARDGSLVVMMGLSVGPMSDEDLTALVSYVRTIAPVSNPLPAEEFGIIGKLMAKKITPGKLTTVPPYAPPGGISVARGRYLAEGPAMCFGCHTPFDLLSFKVDGAMFSGASMAEPDHEDGSMEIVAPNLTPDPETGHIAAWSEAQFVARMKGGLLYAGSKMPWNAFKLMTDEDTVSIYRFLRTLPPTKHAVGPTRRPSGWKPEKQ